MSWTKPTRDDLTASLSENEIGAYSGSSDFTDAVEAILSRTVALVRGFVRAGGTRLSLSADLLPPALMAPAMDYAAFDLLKRFDIPINEDRRKARTDATELFNRVAEGKMAIEPEDDPEGASAPAAAPAAAAPHPERLLD